MSSHQTTNFQLSQWEPNDEVLRADFNSDNLKLETALSAIKAVADAAYTTNSPPVAFGWYQGDGTAKRKIDLGFTPKAVLVMRTDGVTTYRGTSSYAYCGGLALTGRNASASNTQGVAEWNSALTLVAVTDGGFYVNQTDDITCNYSGYAYHYLAFR